MTRRSSISLGMNLGRSEMLEQREGTRFGLSIVCVYFSQKRKPAKEHALKYII